MQAGTSNSKALSWAEIELRLNELDGAISGWEDLVSNQIPGDTDKREFLAVIGNLYQRTASLQNRYYDLIESAYQELKRAQSRPDIFPLDPNFKRVIEIMKTIPDAKKKFFRHKT
jgi:hypothetical protein